MKKRGRQTNDEKGKRLEYVERKLVEKNHNGTWNFSYGVSQRANTMKNRLYQITQ